MVGCRSGLLVEPFDRAVLERTYVHVCTGKRSEGKPSERNVVYNNRRVTAIWILSKVAVALGEDSVRSGDTKLMSDSE
jgi:hypothetical protein